MKIPTALRVLLMLLIILIITALAFWPHPEEQSQAPLSGLPVAKGNFQKADGSYKLEFPRDYGPHNDYQSEWWYYTGNLQSADGRQYGFELTFFRQAIQGPDLRTPRPSDWATEQVYMAHFTLTDVSAGKFNYFERFSRGAGGLAGATVEPAYSVWLESWSVQATGKDTYELKADAGSIALDLALKDGKGPVLQGWNGLSTKGPEPGNASYYSSQTRLVTGGIVRVDGATVQVQGLSWMDHEFSTSALGSDLVGWDWFALQLSDGSELMLYNLRHKDGSIDPYSNGTLIRKDGSTKTLKREDFQITSIGTWKSPHSGATYPAAWMIEVPSEGVRLEVKPKLADQELRVSFTYWEGAVLINGTKGGQPVTGSGYVELTGYAKSMQGQF